MHRASFLTVCALQFAVTLPVHALQFFISILGQHSNAWTSNRGLVPSSNAVNQVRGAQGLTETPEVGGCWIMWLRILLCPKHLKCPLPFEALQRMVAVSWCGFIRIWVTWLHSLPVYSVYSPFPPICFACESSIVISAESGPGLFCEESCAPAVLYT